MRLSSSAPRRFPALDGARGIAVLFVLVDHVFDSRRLQLSRGLDLDGAGFFGVLLFFVLSAFLLTYLFFIQPKEHLAHPATWLNYVLRRFLRIFPLYFLAVLAMAWVEPDFVAADVWNHLLLRDGQDHFWTIAVEVKYYFLLPAVVVLSALLLHGRWRIGVAFAGLAALLLYFAGGFIETVWSMDKDVWLSEYLGVFLTGSAAGILYATIVRQEWDLSRFRTWFDVVGTLCLLLAVVRIPGVYSLLHPAPEAVDKLSGDLPIMTALWSIFVLCVLLGRGWLQALLSSAPLRWLGLVSYSVYLWHPFVLDYAEELRVPFGLRWLVFVGGTAALATATYWCVERPLSAIRLPSRPHRERGFDTAVSQPSS